jgi:ABC-type antimicrobial peptide transport system permease subunit
VFSLTYIRRELTRRRGRTILTALGLGVGVGLVIAITALASGLNRAQAQVLNPLAGIGTDLMVTRTVNLSAAGQPQPNGRGTSLADVQALQAEAQSASQNALLDLSKLGKPGDHFVHDFFLPATQLTFPADEAQQIRNLPHVAQVANGLTLVANHQEGTVPEIVAEFHTQQQTIDISPPTPAEQVAINACVQKLMPSPSPGQLPGRGQFNQQLPPGFIDCLPPRFRQLVIQAQVLRQTIAPPQTDIATQTYTVAGLDVTQPGMGLITPAQLTSGRFLTTHPTQPEAIVATAYAQRINVKLGSALTINGTSFQVVGLARPPLGGQSADVYLALGELQQLSNRTDRANVMLVRADSSANVDQVAHAIEAAFAGAQVTTAKDLAKQVSGSLVDASNLAGRLGLVLALVVLASSFLIAILLTLSSVGKRVRELGTLRAIGWRKGAVVRQVLGESLVQGIIGAIAGIGLGIVVTLAIVAFAPPLHATAAALAGPSAGFGGFGLGNFGAAAGPVTQDVRLQGVIDASIVALAVALAVAGGLIAGAAGAMRAARLRPADALRELG